MAVVHKVVRCLVSIQTKLLHHKRTCLEQLYMMLVSRFLATSPVTLYLELLNMTPETFTSRSLNLKAQTQAIPADRVPGEV